MKMLILINPLMLRKTNIVSISLPMNLTKAVDTLSKQTNQTRSELVCNALREYLTDLENDRKRFIKVLKSTRNEKTISMDALRKKYNLV